MAEGVQRQYTKRHEARELLLEAAIDLLKQGPFSQVTTRAIADRAGLNIVAIQTAFGGQLALYSAAAERLLDEVVKDVNSLPDGPASMELLFNPNLLLRARLVAWLLGEGVDPSLFTISDDHDFVQIAIQRQISMGVHPDVASVFARFVGLAIAGLAVFSETLDRPPEDIALALEMVDALRSYLPDVSRKLRGPADDVAPPENS